MLTGCALYLGETLPENKVGSHGFAVNLGVTLGISVVLNAGILVSSDDIDSKSWLIVGFIPVVVAVFNFLLWLLCFKNEPIGYCVSNREKKDFKAQAYDGITRLYRTGNDMQVVCQIYEAKIAGPDDDEKYADHENTNIADSTLDQGSDASIRVQDGSDGPN